MQRPIDVEVMVSAVVGCNLEKALISGRVDLVGAGLVVQLYLNGVVGPTHHQEMILPVINLMGKRETLREEKLTHKLLFTCSPTG